MMHKLLSSTFAIGALTLLISPVRPPAPADPPEIEAEAWIAVDVESGVTLAGFNPDEERAMASVTKLMTAIVVRENADLDTRVRISENAADIGEAEIGLVAGEVWSVRDLLAAVMVRSGNDAAIALAEHVAGSVEGFAELMNRKALELGLGHSHFMNPHGLDEDGHYTSARDLATLASVVLEDEVLAQLARTGIVRFKPSPDGTDRIAVNTNLLLNRYPGVVGMKTGYTGLAGRVLVSAIETEGQLVIVVVMGSEDHFSDTAAILDYLTQVLNPYDRILAPLVEEEGGGGLALLSSTMQPFVKSRAPLARGDESTTPWGETPGSRRLENMVREMIPIVLGGSS